MDYEKKYKALVEAVKTLKEANPSDEGIQNWVNDNVPELKESEDERIRKALIGYFNDFTLPTFEGLEPKKILAWLEKQVPTCLSHDDEIMIRQLTEYFTTGEGLQNTNGTVVEWLTDVKIKLEKQGEQEYIDPDTLVQQRVDALTNKVEPKFKVGDILVSDEEDRRHIYKVDAITNYDTYLLLDLEDGYTRNEPTYTSDLAMYLWTIQDAKDGDVIYLPNGNNEYYFFIFKGIENAAVKSFAHFYQYNDGTSEVEGTIDKLSSVNDVFQPATKEQRDLLFSKMKEAGYEWDAEKKELKKIEQEDIDLTDFESALFSAFSDAWQSYLQGEEVNIKQWAKEHSKELLESTKEELKGQNPAWSEEDENKFDMFNIWIQYNLDAPEEEKRELLNWLKSLRPQKHWKPSEEQIKALEKACDKHWEPDGLDPLYTLYQDLKKLMEE